MSGGHRFDTEGEDGGDAVCVSDGEAVAGTGTPGDRRAGALLGTGAVIARGRQRSSRLAELLALRRPLGLSWRVMAQRGARLRSCRARSSDGHASRQPSPGERSGWTPQSRAPHIPPSRSLSPLVLGCRVSVGRHPGVHGRAGAAAAEAARWPSSERCAGVEGCPRRSPYEEEAKRLGSRSPGVERRPAVRGGRCALCTAGPRPAVPVRAGRRRGATAGLRWRPSGSRGPDGG